MEIDSLESLFFCFVFFLAFVEGLSVGSFFGRKIGDFMAVGDGFKLKLGDETGYEGGWLDAGRG